MRQGIPEGQGMVDRPGVILTLSRHQDKGGLGRRDQLKDWMAVS